MVRRPAAVHMQNPTSKHTSSTITYDYTRQQIELVVSNSLQVAISRIDRPVDWLNTNVLPEPRKQSLTKGDRVDERNKEQKAW